MDDQIRKMLEAILKQNNQVHWCGGYMHGRTTKDSSPYVILYPSSEHKNFKICRVYDWGFKNLPHFVDTNVQENAFSGKNTPDKDEAKRLGLFVECPSFKLVTYQGRDTPIGPEITFSDTLWIPQQNKPVQVNIKANSKTHTNPQKPTRPAKPANAEKCAVCKHPLPDHAGGCSMRKQPGKADQPAVKRKIKTRPTQPTKPKGKRVTRENGVLPPLYKFIQAKLSKKYAPDMETMILIVSGLGLAGRRVDVISEHLELYTEHRNAGVEHEKAVELTLSELVNL